MITRLTKESTSAAPRGGARFAISAVSLYVFGTLLFWFLAGVLGGSVGPGELGVWTIYGVSLFALSAALYVLVGWHDPRTTAAAVLLRLSIAALPFSTTLLFAAIALAVTPNNPTMHMASFLGGLVLTLSGWGSLVVLALRPPQPSVTGPNPNEVTP